MNSLKLLIRLTVVSSLLLVVIACAKEPTAAIENADVALQAARATEAATYAETEWTAAQEAITTAKAEVATQGAKFALVRSYSKAEQLLKNAEDLARVAERAGATGRERAKTSAEASLAQVRGDLDRAGELLATLQTCPRKPKGFAQDLELLKGSLEGLVDAVPTVEEPLDAGRYQEAGSVATSLGGEVSKFLADLEQAKTKIGC